MVGRAFSFIRRQDPARLLVILSLVSIAFWLILNALPDSMTCATATRVVLIVATGVVTKSPVVVLLPLTLATALTRERASRRLLRLGAIWVIALFLLISALALLRQPLVELANRVAMRYVPASGDRPHVGLELADLPHPRFWVTPDPHAPIVQQYRQMWHSGEVYVREMLLAVVMVGVWLSVGRFVRRKVPAAILIAVLTLGLLTLTESVNAYLLLDYDIFFLGIWSDSVLLESWFAVFQSAASLVFFAYALTLGIATWLATGLRRPLAPNEIPDRPGCAR